MYLATPSGRVDQAVIVESVYFYATDETLPGLIVTPTCDFENSKCELAQVCAVRDAHSTISLLLRGAWSNLGLTQPSGALATTIGDSARKTLAGRIKELAKHKYPRYHWLEPLPNGTVPKLVDFQLMMSVDVVELEAAPIVAELASPFREEVAARYSAYMGRVGTPDFTTTQLEQWAVGCINLLFPTPLAD